MRVKEQKNVSADLASSLCGHPEKEILLQFCAIALTTFDVLHHLFYHYAVCKLKL